MILTELMEAQTLQARLSGDSDSRVNLATPLVPFVYKFSGYCRGERKTRKLQLQVTGRLLVQLPGFRPRLPEAGRSRGAFARVFRAGLLLACGSESESAAASRI